MKKIIIILEVAILLTIAIFLYRVFLFWEKEKKENDKLNFQKKIITSIYQQEKNNISEDIIIDYPNFGEQYATLKIENIEVNLPVYYGANYDILKKGIGHDDKSYFPGEGGSIILAGHNFKRLLGSLPKVKIGDEIILETEFGKFYYKIYETKIIHETDVEMVPIQKEEEILMIYTCYPINNIGHPYKRYVVYANLEK